MGNDANCIYGKLQKLQFLTALPACQDDVTQFFGRIKRTLFHYRYFFSFRLSYLSDHAFSRFLLVSVASHHTNKPIVFSLQKKKSGDQNYIMRLSRNWSRKTAWRVHSTSAEEAKTRNTKHTFQTSHYFAQYFYYELTFWHKSKKIIDNSCTTAKGICRSTKISSLQQLELLSVV